MMLPDTTNGWFMIGMLAIDAIVLGIVARDVFKEHVRKKKLRGTHKFAFQRALLAEYLENCTWQERQTFLARLEEDFPEMYESWINESYPAETDR